MSTNLGGGVSERALKGRVCFVLLLSSNINSRSPESYSASLKIRVCFGFILLLTATFGLAYATTKKLMSSCHTMFINARENT